MTRPFSDRQKQKRVTLEKQDSEYQILYFFTVLSHVASEKEANGKLEVVIPLLCMSNGSS